MANVKPRFEVHKLEGTSIRTIATPRASFYEEVVFVVNAQGKAVLGEDKKPLILHKVGDPKRKLDGTVILLGGFDYEDKEVDAGWMVYFPSGSSIRIWTREEMERQGFLRPPGLVDMDTGDSVAPTQDTSLKAVSERKTHRTKSSRVAQT